MILAEGSLTPAGGGTFLSRQESTQRSRPGEALRLIPFVSAVLVLPFSSESKPPSPGPLPAKARRSSCSDRPFCGGYFVFSDIL